MNFYENVQTSQNNFETLKTELIVNKPGKSYYDLLFVKQNFTVKEPEKLRNN